MTSGLNSSEQKINWGPTGEIVYNRTYSRPKPDGLQEIWFETVDRVVKGNVNLVGAEYIETDEVKKLTELMREFKILPAGRHLWASGVSGRQFLFNCHVSHWNEILSDHFEFTFMRLMEGGGVGSNYSTKYISQYDILQELDVHIVCDPSHADYEELAAKNVLSTKFVADWPGAFEVEDSREGWAAALVDLTNTFTCSAVAHSDRVFDISRIRPKGARIKGFGGTASGPLALAVMLIKIAEIFSATFAIGGKLTPTLLMECDHAIAEAVVSGGTRRSARMAMVHWTDPEIFAFIKSKADKSKHWTTNISVEIDDEFVNLVRREKVSKAVTERKVLADNVLQECVKAMLTNGEPGFWNHDLSNHGEPVEVVCTNPCGEISLSGWENCFGGDEKLITKEYGVTTFAEIEGENVTVITPTGWQKAQGNSFGEQPVQRIVFAPVHKSSNKLSWQRSRSNYLVNVTATPTHRWMTVDDEVTSELVVGHVVPMQAATEVIKNKEYDDGVRHGIIFGDGSADRQYANGDWRHRVRFFGVNAQEMASYFEHVTFPNAKGCLGEGWLRNSTSLKTFPASSNDSNYLAGFLYGWCLADGSVRDNDSIQLTSGNPDAEQWLCNYAAVAGKILRGVTVMPDTTNYGPRKAPHKSFTLANADNKDLAWQVVSIEPLPVAQTVYCVTVPEGEKFALASGILTMNCNLGHVNLDAFANDFNGVHEAHRLMARFLVRATFGDVTSEKQAEVLHKQRRIGVGHFGFQGYLVKQGIRYSDSHRNPKIRKALTSFRKTVREASREYAFQLRIPEPVKTTTLAPTGSIAKLPGRTEGGHAIYSRYFWRRVRFNKTRALEANQIAEFKAQGLSIETDLYDSSGNTVVVSFPTKELLVEEVENLGLDAEYLVESQDEVPLQDLLEIQAMYQTHYADNAVSFTVNMPAETRQQESMLNDVFGGMPEPSEERVAVVKTALVSVLPLLKGTTIMIDGSRPQAPYERMSKEDYENAEHHSVDSSVDEDCASGSCPIR